MHVNIPHSHPIFFFIINLQDSDISLGNLRDFLHNLQFSDFHHALYQKPNPATDNYKLDIPIYDANGALIGRVAEADVPAGVGVGVTSTLQYVMVVTTGKVDNDAVLFNYGAQT